MKTITLTTLFVTLLTMISLLPLGASASMCTLSLVGASKTPYRDVGARNLTFEEENGSTELIGSEMLLNSNRKFSEVFPNFVSMARPDFQGRTIQFLPKYDLAPAEGQPKTLEVSLSRIENGFFKMSGTTQLGVLKVSIPGSAVLPIPIAVSGTMEYYAAILSCINL